MTISRTFHTIGQGAFYSEKFRWDIDKSFTIVYDCGSSTLSDLALKKKIKQDLGGFDIDILFVSHFHADHTNGIKHLNPKIIFLPLLSQQQKIILHFLNVFGIQNINEQLLWNPEQVFPDIPLVFIAPDETNETPLRENFPPININNPEFRYSKSSPLTLKNNTPIILKSQDNGNSNLQDIWEYIPYNPYWFTNYNKLREAIQDKKLDIDKIEANPNGKYVKNNLDVIKNAFTSILPGKENRHSMLLYSGPLKEDRKVFTERFCHLCLRIYKIGPAAIYSGDMTISHEWIDSYLNNISQNKLNLIGTIQIPHHGSHESHGEMLVEEVRKRQTPHYQGLICAISCGEKNSYGHPSTDLIEKIILQEVFLHVITEKASSFLSNSFFISF